MSAGAKAGLNTYACPADTRARREHKTLASRALARNYTALSIDGGAFSGAIMMVNASTLLPVIINSLGGPNWLIAMMPVMMMIGFQLPPLFTAHWIERQRFYKPLLLTTGVGQRLPYLIAAIVLFMAESPTIIIAAVALAPLVSGLFGGLTGTGFMQLVQKQIPEERRASVFAVRNAVGATIGIAAGFIVKWVLAEHPGTIGYGILHAIAFCLLVVSWIVFAMIREMPTPTRLLADKSLGLLDNLRAMPSLLTCDRRFSLYLGVRFFRNAMHVLTAFLSVHCVMVLGASPEFVGQLIIVQQIGGIIGNLATAYIGDKWGSKIASIFGNGVSVALSIWAIFATSSWEFQAIFFLLGFAMFAGEVGVQALGLAVCPTTRRSTMLSLMSVVNLIGTLAAWGLATVLRGGSEQRFTPIAVATIVGLLLGIICVIPVRDPRHDRMVPA